MYIKIDENGNKIFPYTLDMLKTLEPSTVFPRNPTKELLANYGIVPITLTAKPSYNSMTQTLDRSFDTDGNEVWTVSDLPVEDAEANVRSARDQALADTDWYIIKSKEMDEAVPVNVLTYRQSLRDITDHVDFPYVDLPVL